MRKPSPAKRDSKKAGAWSDKLQNKMVVVEDAGGHGEGCRHSSPHQPPGVPGREKSCRLRWIRTDTRPDLNRENFGEDEEDLIIKLHALLGNRWSLIAGRLPGRTDNEVENYWNSHLKRKLVSMGIDPNNHRIYHTLPRCKNKNQIPVISNSDDSSTCATSAVSKALKYEDQNKIHDLSNGTDYIELSVTSDKKVTELPDLCVELPITNRKPHACAQEKKSAATLLL